MGGTSNPLQTQGYFGGSSNDPEQGALDEAERNNEYGERPSFSPTPDPSAALDSIPEIPQNANIFDSVSATIQSQEEIGNVGVEEPNEDSVSDAADALDTSGS